jgi:hypothetical protein
MADESMEKLMEKLEKLNLGSKFEYENYEKDGVYLISERRKINVVSGHPIVYDKCIVKQIEATTDFELSTPMGVFESEHKILNVLNIYFDESKDNRYDIYKLLLSDNKDNSLMRLFSINSGKDITIVSKNDNKIEQLYITMYNIVLEKSFLRYSH